MPPRFAHYLPRSLSLVALLAFITTVDAEEPFTQKPVVAPAITLGTTPKATVPAVVPEGWTEKFNAGPVPSWIWGASFDQNYTLTKSFEAGNVSSAKLKVSADNHVVLFLNGKQVASSDEWQEPAEADVTALIKDKNELVAHVKNDGGVAGLVFKLALVDKATGKISYIVSDASWTATNTRSKPAAARAVGKYGDQPWGRVFEHDALPDRFKSPRQYFPDAPRLQG